SSLHGLGCGGFSLLADAAGDLAADRDHVLDTLALLDGQWNLNDQLVLGSESAGNFLHVHALGKHHVPPELASNLGVPLCVLTEGPDVELPADRLERHIVRLEAFDVDLHRDLVLVRAGQHLDLLHDALLPLGPGSTVVRRRRQERGLWEHAIQVPHAVRELLGEFVHLTPDVGRAGTLEDTVKLLHLRPGLRRGVHGDVDGARHSCT
ncbi:unnamed protein product, partial [Ixodes persulcatus]